MIPLIFAYIKLITKKGRKNMESEFQKILDSLREPAVNNATKVTIKNQTHQTHLPNIRTDMEKMAVFERQVFSLIHNDKNSIC